VVKSDHLFGYRVLSGGTVYT